MTDVRASYDAGRIKTMQRYKNTKIGRSAVARSILALTLAGVLLLACVIAPAHEAHAAPWLFFEMSINGNAELDHGSTAQLVISVYSASAVPLTPTLDIQFPLGVTLARPMRYNNTDVYQDHPMLILVDIAITDDAPDQGVLLPITATLNDTAGNTRNALIYIRVGTYKWPDPVCDVCQHIVYLPIISR